MANIIFENTGIEDLQLVHPFYAEDERGYFIKSFEKRVFLEKGIDCEVAETFESFSKKGVIRGLHFQSGESAQAKLVRVLLGEVYDVCVDIRKESSTFGKWYGKYLNDENHLGIFIPKGFAHGFLVTSDYALMSYTTVGEHNEAGESGIKYDDDVLNINWPIEKGEKIIQSKRDKELLSFEKYKDSL